MKDSGIEWIKEIPAEWSVARGKSILKLQKRSPESYEEVITCFRDGEVTQRKNRREDGFTFSDKEIGYQGIHTGDLVIHGMDGFAGAIGISDSDGKGSPVLVVCTSEQNQRYLMYYLRMLATQNVFVALSTGIRERSCDLRWNKIAELLFPIPPMDVQDKITAFLDNKCSKVDGVIARQQEAIEKLKDYKLSVIAEAVTKGLNLNVPMKDSGIEWIGQIPAHWYMHKFCWDYSAMLGKMLDAKRVKGNNLHPYIKNADVQWFSINNKDLDEMDFDESETERYSVRPGDLMICEGGEIGKCAIVPADFPKGVYYQKALHRVRKRNEKSGNIEFLSYLMFVMAKNNCFNTSPEKATIAHLPGDALAQLRIPAPPFEEQCGIVNYLNEKCQSIENAINLRAKVVHRLTEYKKSLIYEVVTGKREVE